MSSLLDKNRIRFIEKSRIKHSDKYDYSRVAYNGWNHAVEIICPIHGSFFQKPYIHAEGHGCQKCGVRRKYKNLKSGFPLVAEQWHFAKNKGLTPESIAATTSTKYWWQCPASDNHIYLASPANRIKGRGCPYCVNKKLKYEDSLEVTKPEIASQWHESKNGDLMPCDVSPSSSKNVWWKCDVADDHVWMTAVYARTSTNNCPYCANQKVSVTNSIHTIAPHILQEWDYERNQGIDPDTFTAYTHTKIWWVCRRSNKHRWKASVRNRAVGNKTGCPFCTSQTSSPEIRLFVELKSLFPDAQLRSKVHGVEADILVPSINLVIEYDGAYWHKNSILRDKKKNKHMMLYGYEIIRVRCAPLLPIGDNDVVVRSDDMEKDDVDSVVNSVRNLNIVNSDICDRYIEKERFSADKVYRKYMSYLPSPFPDDSLQNKEPDISEEWNKSKNYPLLPINFTSQSHKKVWWRCEEDHEWEARIVDRVKGNKCPFCQGKFVGKSDSFPVKFPELFAEFIGLSNHQIDVYNLSPNSGRLADWQCSKCRKTWKESIVKRSHGSECPYCVPRLEKKRGSLFDEYPEIAKTFHPYKNADLSPNDLTSGSSQSVWWRCPNDPSHAWQSIVYNRIRQGENPCPFCMNRRADVSNSLEDVYPEIAREWYFKLNGGLKAEDVVAGSAKKVWWKCPVDDDHIWQAGIRDRIKSNGCPFCSGRRLSKSSSLAATFPNVASEWHPVLNAPLTPKDLIAGSTKRVWWMCAKNNGHVWDAVVWKRTKAGRGCPFCAGKRSAEKSHYL